MYRSLPAVCRLAALSCFVLANLALGVEAPLPEGALATFGRTPYHNGARIRASELSADGKRLATLGARSATVWDTTTGRPIHRFFFAVQKWPGHDRILAFSPNGKWLACRPSPNRITVWDLATGREVKRFAVGSTNYSFAFCRFSVDGKALIVQTSDGVDWLDIASGAAVRRLPGVRFKQLSPDDRTFAWTDAKHKQVVVGDATTGKVRHRLSVAADPWGVREGLLFLPDGVTLAVVGEQTTAEERKDERKHRKEVQFWDVRTGKRGGKTWSLPDSDRSEDYRLALSPDGKVLYFPEDRKNIRRYVLTTGKELSPLSLYGNWIAAVLPHPDGKTLFAVHLDVIRRWDLARGEEIEGKSFLDWKESAVSSDGRWVALRAYQGRLELWDAEARKGKQIDMPTGNGRTLAFSPDGKILAVNRYYSVQFLRVPALDEIRKLEINPEEASLQFSPDGRYLAVTTTTALLRLVDVKTGKDAWSQSETALLAFTPDGKRILVRSRKDGRIRLHETATRKLCFEIPAPSDRAGRRDASVSSIAFSPTGRILAVAMTGGHVCLLDAETGEERGRFLSMPTDEFAGEGQHYLHATALAFSPDGQWLAVGGEDGFLHIHDAHTRRELHRLHGHEGAASCLTFTANGRRLVSFGEGEGFLWDLRPKQQRPKKSDPFNDLLSEDGPTVYRALWLLADDPQTPARLRKVFSPVRIDARPERVARLIADLGAEQFQVRESASKALAALQDNPRPALLAALAKKPELEQSLRLRRLLKALRGDPSAADLQQLRAVRALELQGGEAARKVLLEWSRGTPGFRLTDAARAAPARNR